MDAVLIKENLAPDEAMGPSFLSEEGVSEDVDTAFFIAPAQIDDATREGSTEMELPRLGKRATVRGLSDTLGVLGPVSGDELFGAREESVERGMVEAVPDGFTPSGIEAFDGSLEASFAGRREDRDHSELEAGPDDSTDGIGILMRALEARGVVELGIGRQTDLGPMLEDTFQGPRGSGRAWEGPSRGQCAMNRDGGKDVDQGSFFDEQVLDEIEAVQFGLAGG